MITGDYSDTPPWASRPITVGAKVDKPTPIFTKLDPSVVDEELARAAAGWADGRWLARRIVRVRPAGFGPRPGC